MKGPALKPFQDSPHARVKFSFEGLASKLREIWSKYQRKPNAATIEAIYRVPSCVETRGTQYTAVV